MLPWPSLHGKSFFQNETSPAEMEFPKEERTRKPGLAAPISGGRHWNVGTGMLRGSPETPPGTRQAQHSAPTPHSRLGTGSGGLSARPRGVLRPQAAHFLCDQADGRSQARSCSGKIPKMNPELALL